MSKQTKKENNTSVLRKKAEERLRRLTTKLPHELSASDSLNLIHELQVHQIELEMQNEELLRIQQELEESRLKYSDLYDFAPVGYFTFDKKGVILEVNLTGASLLDIERQSLINNLFSQYIMKESQDEFLLHRRKVIDTSERQTSEIKLKKKDGSELYTQLDSIAIEDPEGNTLCRTSIIDITLRKQLEKERERVTAKLSAKSMELEKILFVTNHDLRAPLVNIEGYSRELYYSLKELIIAIDNKDISLAVKEKITPIVQKEIPESLDYIHSSIVKMENLIKGVFDISRIGRSSLKIDEIDMNKLIADIVRTHQYKLNVSGISMDVLDLPGCKGDSSQLNQVFSNLLDNAIKNIHPEREGAIIFSGHKEGKTLVYCIEDNGIGIDYDCQNEIFEIFHQLDPENSDGEGMGLAIVKRILEAHNGDIRVESEPGKGSKFFVSLPNIESDIIPDDT